MNTKQIEQLKTLAVDIKAGRVFTSWQVNDRQLLPLIFMPIALGGFKKNWVFFYSYYDSHVSHPRSIRDYPIFGSVGGLNKTKEKKLIEILNILNEKEKETLDSIGENNGNT